MKEKNGVERSTATEILRHLLDERGVEYETCDTTFNGVSATFWHDRDGYPCAAISGTDDIPDGEVSVQAPVTPEQAIAATLGSCNCSDNCTNSERTETCKVDVLNTGDCAGYECSEYIMHCNGCGHEFGHVLYNEDGDVWMSEPPNYCPNCGRRCVG